MSKNHKNKYFIQYSISIARSAPSSGYCFIESTTDQIDEDLKTVKSSIQAGAGSGSEVDIIGLAKV